MFRDRLEDLVERIDGALALTLVARDGIIVQSVSRGEHPDLEVLAAEIPERLRMLARQVPELKDSDLRYMNVTTDRYTMMLSSLNDDYSLLLLMGPEGSGGRARFELRRALLDFAADLG